MTDMMVPTTVAMIVFLYAVIQPVHLRQVCSPSANDEIVDHEGVTFTECTLWKEDNIWQRRST
jgi:hypothetical protein